MRTSCAACARSAPSVLSRWMTSTKPTTPNTRHAATAMRAEDAQAAGRAGEGLGDQLRGPATRVGGLVATVCTVRSRYVFSVAAVSVDGPESSSIEVGGTELAQLLDARAVDVAQPPRLAHHRRLELVRTKRPLPNPSSRGVAARISRSRATASLVGREVGRGGEAGEDLDQLVVGVVVERERQPEPALEPGVRRDELAPSGPGSRRRSRAARRGGPPSPSRACRSLRRRSRRCASAYASSMKSAPPSAFSIISAVLIAVWPT